MNTTLWNMKLAVILNVNGALGTVTKRLIKGLEDLEMIGRTVTKYKSINNISQNAKNNRGNLSRVVVTQTPVENYQLKLV